MMTSDHVMDLLQEYYSFHKAHFVLTGGGHSDVYVDCGEILSRPKETHQLAYTIVQHTIAYEPAIVITAGNAVSLGVHTAFILRHNGNVPDIRWIEARKNPDNTFSFKRGAAEKINGSRVVVVEDIWTTGSSTHAVVEAILTCGGSVVSVSALINRGNATKKDVGDVRHFLSLCEVDAAPPPFF